MNLYPLPPLASGREALLNIFKRPPFAEAAARAADQAGLSPRTPEIGPNKLVSLGIGAQTVGVVQTVDASQAQMVASNMNADYRLLVNSSGGTTEVQPVIGNINGLANLHNGIADLSGFHPLGSV